MFPGTEGSDVRSGCLPSRCTCSQTQRVVTCEASGCLICARVPGHRVVTCEASGSLIGAHVPGHRVVKSEAGGCLIPETDSGDMRSGWLSNSCTCSRTLRVVKSEAGGCPIGVHFPRNWEWWHAKLSGWLSSRPVLCCGVWISLPSLRPVIVSDSSLAPQVSHQMHLKIRSTNIIASSMLQKTWISGRSRGLRKVIWPPPPPPVQ
jgi:hypothetical protein